MTIYTLGIYLAHFLSKFTLHCQFYKLYFNYIFTV